MAEPRRRRILRFFGPSAHLLVADVAGITMYEPSGDLRLRTTLEGILDVAAVGDELWALTPGRLTRLSVRDGEVLGSEPLDHLEPGGRVMQSSTAPQLPVWHCSQPVVLRLGPARTEVPGPGGELILPIAENRWLLWNNGQLRLWRSTIGEAWRTPVGDRGVRAVDAQLLLEGRLVVLVQHRATPAGPEGHEVRLSVAQVADGAQNTQLRVPAVNQLVFAARRGFALARSADRLSVFDLRFGRWIRDLVVPEGTLHLAVDDGLQRIALATSDGIELVPVEALAVSLPVRGGGPAAGDPTVRPVAGEADPPAEPAEPVEPVEPAAVAPIEVVDALSDDPLIRLDPVTATSTATIEQIAHAVELRLQLMGALAAAAIADAWDTGRISKTDPHRPPFADEVGGLLRIASGRQPDELVSAIVRLRTIEELVVAADQERGAHLTPLDVLAIDCDLTPAAVAILFAILAPRLRGELARMYGILANDPGRPLVDEHLLGQLLAQLLGGDTATLTRELDGDRPLRRYGLVQVGGGERPFAALSVDPLVVRYVANFDLAGEPDPHLVMRQADRELSELHLPRAAIAKALRYLSSPRPGEPARLVVRGRTGCGRHTLLAALAARAGRALGVIDPTTMPRDSNVLPGMVETALRRAKLRGLLPCVDGLELVGADHPDTKIQLGAVLRDHPGPIALRLPAEAQVPLDPGYLLIDLPQRNERERGESWAVALERHHIELPDASELAARYRVGPGIVEQVCAEVARRPDPPTEPTAWMRELDDAVRQHLENRLGATANRVTRLASWADIVLPEDITDSLLELTARVRHRKQVYEHWGFDRSMTTSRGITALFQGSPGTGKTMVAGVIARDLGLELYRVDVSRITSKWIGETEKNLGSLFDAAEDGQVMLLFDEADSLFARRTEVKTSVDRYANMEVNYLLQRLDSFEGIAILTTNFGNAIDPAFKRRLTYRVTFPFPDEDMREQLWRSLIPAEVPVSGAIDFAALSQRFRLSGGYIRNAALRAAFLAAEEGSSLTHAHLERAIRMEFREIGKLAETGTLE
ncbi:MAG TPA: ATP-binding protein [Kofleriaceae bacterium]|nr:ATP-binding protein [Kofleriaceae bacterium]